mgnify:CR=1 FL=1
MKIAVLCGGRSSERDVSLSTGIQVARALRETGHDVVLVDACVDFPLDCRPEEVFEKALPIENHAIGAAAPCVERFFDRASGFFGKNVLEICKSADIVFNALHGDEGENGKLQAVFDLLNICYTGSGAQGCMLAMNKSLSKQLFRTHGIPTPEAVILSESDKCRAAELCEKLGLPCVVKPASLGSSVGVSIVRTNDEFFTALDSAFSLENTVIVVSHDRYFLNKVCTHICDVDFGKIQMYAGNYDFWYEYTQMRQRQMRDQNKKNEQKIKELQEFIQRFSANASKSKQATSRKKQLDALEMIDMPVSSRRFPYVDFKPDRECGNDLLRVDHLTKTIGDRKVLDDVSFVIHPREKVAFVGSDAVAKTTLFKIIMGEVEPDEGEFKWGVTTSQSYFPSDNSKYFDGVDLSLVDWLRQYTTQTLEADIRGWLGRMLFSGEEALKKATVLSGGERVRCMLCKMMLSGANVLVLDEPTNHLDLESITALNNGLIRYPETVLFTSHDHQFIQTIADRIIDISDGKITDYKGNYDDFLENFDDDKLKKY